MILLCYDTDALVAGMCFIQIKSFKFQVSSFKVNWHKFVGDNASNLFHIMHEYFNNVYDALSLLVVFSEWMRK